ncbi:MAG: ribosome biogenesis GTPase Der, partial [Terriglobales bacterium]
IVGDEPGITRDRIYAEAEWLGRRLRLVDTGGILPDDKEPIPAEVFRQARVALEEAAAIVMVVDGRSELAAPDLDLARLLLRTGKPLFLAVNKLDTPRLEAVADEFRRLGIRNVFPVSAENGTGVVELLEAVLDKIPAAKGARVAEQEEAAAEAGLAAQEIKVAIIGRPNVGKSTLLNRLTGSARAIVSEIPGTTRDAVDEIVERDGHVYRFIDTAGIRRKGKTKLMAEKLSVVMARKHLESADVALLMIDAVEGVTALDANIAGYAHESGRSLIVVVNKWDLVAGPNVTRPRSSERTPGGRIRPGEDEPASPHDYEHRLRYKLKFLSYAPVLFISATSGKNVEKVFATVELVAAERSKRISTSEINR